MACVHMPICLFVSERCGAIAVEVRFKLRTDWGSELLGPPGVWLETGSSVQRMQEGDRDRAHDNDLKSMYMLFILKQDSYWVVSRTSKNRNLRPSKDTETKEPQAKSLPRTMPVRTPLLTPCWALDVTRWHCGHAAAGPWHRTREAFQRPGMSLLGALEVT